jgi:hypothetical protein
VLLLQGDKYGTEDGDLYFNSKTGALDDVYGDYAFGQPEEHSSCKLGSNGAPILDGKVCLIGTWFTLLTLLQADPGDGSYCACQDIRLGLQQQFCFELVQLA